ncbi:MAG TPA: PIN domain-containing protein [Polyangiaceae bacterium]|nr:PIN domain-containing protein [Polyangiaceae bacterium]
MKAVVYDAGVLIAADRSKRRVWAAHRIRLEAGLIPMVPASVVAQVSRSAKQAQMRRLLRGCEVVAFDETAAHAAGALLGKTRTRDVVDASVVELSIRKAADIVSDDADDIRRLLAAANAKTSILDL